MTTKVLHSRGEYTVELTNVRTVLKQLGDDDFVVTDHNVRLALALPEGCFSVEPGEQSKGVAVYEQLLEWLAARAHRSSRVVAFGGGVVGDLAGFAAATFMRGVRLLQVPTSLLAMVDSSVGGKVGIDLHAGKNLAGAFWPPEHVLIPIDALCTLPERHFVNGTAEVWKYGAIMDAALFDRLVKRPLSPEDEDVADVVMRCVELKRQVVEADEREASGRRAVLNFGHTVGHAIEQALGYEGMLHGEAIAVGMVAEAVLAEQIGEARGPVAERIRQGLAAQGLPTTMPKEIDRAALVETMRRDKKADRNGLAFSLVSEIGTCRLRTGIREADVLRALEGL